MSGVGFNGLEAVEERRPADVNEAHPLSHGA